MKCANYIDLRSNFDVFHGNNQGEENIFSRPIYEKIVKKTYTLLISYRLLVDRFLVQAHG
jgi:hypothetical protein